MQAGYMRQFDNNSTLGAELDWSWVWADDSALGAGGADQLDAELNWLSSARVRAGYAFGRVSAG